jgi:hypothetical protein
VAVIAEKSVVMKQLRGLYASVGIVISIYVDKSLCFGCGTTLFVKKSLKEFVACLFCGIIISTVFLKGYSLQ